MYKTHKIFASIIISQASVDRIKLEKPLSSMKINTNKYISYDTFIIKNIRFVMKTAFINKVINYKLQFINCVNNQIYVIQILVMITIFVTNSF